MNNTVTSARISVILVVWNSSNYLIQCLDCLSAQITKDFEIIIVDNGSIDDSIGKLKGPWPGLTLHIKQLKSNLGFAAANNIGAHIAHGQWLALLNVDTFPKPDWLEKLISATETHPAYSVFSSRQIQANSPDLLDGAGDAYHMTGLAWRRFYNKPVQEYKHQFEEVFSACPAAALYSREEFLKVGGFDEDYFSYFEDVDLGFRLRLGGAKCLYVPEAVVYHVGSASTGKRSDFSVYYGYRNMIWTFVKNMPAPLIWILLPLHISAILFFAMYLTLRGQGKIIWKAIFDAVYGLPKMIEKRKVIQKNKKINPANYLKAISRGCFNPLKDSFQGKRAK